MSLVYRHSLVWAKIEDPCISCQRVDRVSVPSPIVIDILMDTMARDRAHMHLFSV